MVGESVRHRLFTQRQRRILAAVSGGRCQHCNKIFNGDFHADHVVPFIHGGLTILKNGQALCASCNQQKGAKL
jgi:5-methylcytosine-specific restriction endonuclease McrA